MKIGENLLKEVPVEKSILVYFYKFITLVNKWKAKWVHEGYSFFQQKKHQKGPSVSSTPSIWFTFSIERTIARIRQGLFNEGFN